jgi:anaerobic magnesium-protoporphyrin IX monomethyl ester cyclase
MKIVICTTPIRPVPTVYPPFGSMAVINALKKAGFDPMFYDIDGLRPKFEDVEEYFRKEQPDVLGISAVVSTAYSYTKKLVRMLKRVSPNTRVVVGGNLAASAEILHRLANVDICVIGEGEIVGVNVMRALEGMTGRPLDYAVLERIPGLTFLRPDGEMAFTNYELRLPADEVFRPDFELLEKHSRIENYLVSPLTRPEFIKDPRSSQPHRQGKNVIGLITEKGCVARCTFCHRWDKGYRPIPVDQIITHIKHLVGRFNIGFIMFSDENFGSDKRHVEEFLVKIKELDILWTVGGVRVRSVNLDLLKRMKDAGCVSVFYGMETGSPKILEVMEKKASLQDNLNAAKWTREAGLFTIFQMILGMPGEDETTIKETISFLKTVTQDEVASPRSLMSLNYIQALPGTSVYEYARYKGLIGKSLREEEDYLVTISDIDAEDDTRMPNYTEYDYLTVRSWRRRVVMEVMKHYHDHNQTPTPSFPAFLWRWATNKITNTGNHYATDEKDLRNTMIEEYKKGGYFNLQRDLSYDVIVAYFYPLRNLIVAAWFFQDELRRLPLRTFAGHLLDWARLRLKPAPSGEVGAESLRAVMARLAPPALTPTARAMQPLREGR